MLLNQSEGEKVWGSNFFRFCDKKHLAASITLRKTVTKAPGAWRTRLEDFWRMRFDKRL